MTENATAIDARMLPPQARRLVRAIGVAQTFTLLRWRGGRRLKLPRDSTRSEIAAIVGADALEGLLQEFGPHEILTLPKVDKLLLQLRDHALRAEHAGGRGKSIQELAGAYGLTTRHILNILAAERCARPAPERDADPRQPLLL